MKGIIMNLRKGMRVNGRVIERVSEAISGGRPVVVLRFAGGGDASYVRGAPIPGLESARSIELPAGPVAAGWFAAAKPKTRASSGEWAGERAGTRREMFIATAAAFAS